MTKSNLIIFGYDELLLELIEFFSRKKSKISAVVFPSTRNDSRANRIREIVREKGFTILEQPPRRRISGFAAKIRRLKPDLIYSWSYPMILPEEIIKIPKHGAVNLHMGLLPEYRGVNGVRWALINGEEKTGITIHYMDSGIDSGAVISRVSFPITPADDILSLMIKSKTAGLYLLENVWRDIAAGRVNAVAQDESKARFYSSKMSSLEAIDWSKSNTEIHNLIRASAIPFPGVYTFWRERRLVPRKSAPIAGSSVSNDFGKVAKIDSESLEITTGDGNLRLSNIEIEGVAVTIEELSELGLKIGDRFQNS
ncbi:MAG TPA: methionyl-tRNA formyltransferase [Pyrinomonadaceae bacterium]